MRGLLALAAAFCVLAFQGAATSTAASPFHNWAAVVVAGDWRASGGGTTLAFENARRDVHGALLTAGFAPDHVRTLSLKEGTAAADLTTGPNLAAALRQTADAAPGGCLFYLTSHGTPQGAVFGRQGLLAPRVLDRLLTEACQDRPTVVFLSACYSGVYLPVLSAPNRLVLTAARPDRTSFGCGADDKYPFFDACVLQVWPTSTDFLALAQAVKSCVGRREQEMKLTPPSEPQTHAGARIRPLLPLLALPGARRPAA
jgi:hypothetical protein